MCIGASIIALFRCACHRPMPSNTRIENRITGADANPYLAFAASLACGYLGMVEKLNRRSQSRVQLIVMPTHCRSVLDEALDKLNYTKALKQVLGEKFVEAYQDVKFEEMQHYRRVISSWEREYLLLNV